MGAIAVRLVRLEQTEAQLLALAGAFAAIAVLFGGPLVASLMLLELVVLSGAIPSAKIVQALSARLRRGRHRLTRLHGRAGLAGIAPDRAVVAVAPRLRQRAAGRPGVGHRPVCGHRDVGGGHPASRARGRDARHAAPELALVGAGALVGLVAVVFRAAADRPVDLVLFSGQQEMPAVIAESSASVLLLLVVAKGSPTRCHSGPVFAAGRCSRRWRWAWPWPCWRRMSCRVSTRHRRWPSASRRVLRLSCARRSPPSCSRPTAGLRGD